jgi:outer membrane protein, heavy metal efflux system
LSVVAIEGLVLSGGLNEPGSGEGMIDAPDINSTYPIGLFPMIQP